MNERFFENMKDIEQRKLHEQELAEINHAIKYHKTIIKYLRNVGDPDDLEYHRRILDSLKNVRNNISTKREQVRNALKKRGLDY